MAGPSAHAADDVGPNAVTDLDDVTGHAVPSVRVPVLMVVTDRHIAARSGRTVEETVAAALEGGAPAVLLRDKDLPDIERHTLGEQLLRRVRAAGARLLVASDATLARQLGADGIHLAAGDPPGPPAPSPGDGRGPGLIGRSCHDDTEVAAAGRHGADYVFVSPVAATASKPGYGPALGEPGVRRMVAAARGVSVLALGGVTPDNAARWREAGADGIAVMGGVMGASDPAANVRALLATWTAAGDPDGSRLATADPAREQPAIPTAVRSMTVRPESS